MNDNFLENGVLFTQYLTRNFSISVPVQALRLIRMDAALNILLFVRQYIFLSKKEFVLVTTVLC